MQHFLYSRYYRHKLGCQYYILGQISPGLASLPPSSQLNLLAKWCCQLFCITRQKKTNPKPSNSSSVHSSCAEEQRHSRYFLACPESGNGSVPLKVHLIPCFQTWDRYFANCAAVSASRGLEPPRNMYICTFHI